MPKKSPTNSKKTGRATRSKRKSTGDVPESSRKRNCSGTVELANENEDSMDTGIPGQAPSPTAQLTDQTTNNSSCLFCLNPSIITEIEVDPSEFFMMYQNLCKEMMKQNPEEIPGEFSLQMFPSCVHCEQLVQDLWHYQKAMKEIKQKITDILSTFKQVVGDAVLLHLDVHTPFSTSSDDYLDQRPFTKLRDAIFKAYQNDLREQKLLQYTATKTEPPIVIDLVDEPVVSKPKTTESSHSTFVDEQKKCVNVAAIVDNSFNVEIKEEPSEIQNEQDNQRQLSPQKDSGNCNPRKLGGILLIKDSEFELCWEASETTLDTAYIHCSKCSHSKLFSTKDDDEMGMKKAYQRMTSHVLLMHSKDVWKFAGGTAPDSFICRFCDVIFKEELVRNRHECYHHQTYDILRTPGLMTEEERQYAELQRNKQQGRNN